MPLVSTYFQPVSGMPRPAKLLDLWRETWEGKGWTCQVLNEEHAQPHPGFKAFGARVSAYPTSNNRGYERACYLRHMAMAMVGGGILTDYDVMLRSSELPFEGDPLPARPVLLEPTRCPCAIYGDADAFGDICDILFNYDPKGEKHTSDQEILRKTKLQAMDACIEYLHIGWEKAAMIHFANSVIYGKLKLKGDKADLIRDILRSL